MRTGEATFGTEHQAPRRPALLTGEGATPTTSSCPGQTHAAIVRSPHAHARVRAVDTSRALARAGRPRRLHRHGHGRGRRRPLPVGWLLPDLKIPALPRSPSTPCGTSARRGRGRDRRDALRGRATPPSWSWSTTTRCRRSTDGGEGARRRRAAGPRRTRRATSLRLEASATRPRPTRVREGAARVVELRLINQRLIPNAIEPRASLAQYNAASDELTLLDHLAEPARPPAAHGGVRAGHPGAQAARHRARRRRRLRLEDLPLPRRRSSPSGRRKQLGPAGEVDGGPPRELRDRRPRPRPRDRRRARGRRRRARSLGLRVHTDREPRRLSLDSSRRPMPTYLYGTLLSGQYAIPAISLRGDAASSPTRRRSTPYAAPAVPRRPI